jgi:hypothetical protein
MEPAAPTWFDTAMVRHGWPLDKLKVFLTIPNLGWIHDDLVDFIVWMLQDPHEIQLYRPRNFRPTESMRQHCMASFLATDCDIWFSVDNDNAPCLPEIINIADENLPIVGFPTPCYDTDTGSISLNCYDIVKGKHVPRTHGEGLQAVSAIGGGCFMVRRDVAAKVLDQQPFRPEMDDYGRITMSEDLVFSQRVREAAFPIHAHFDYPCHHRKTVDLLQFVAKMTEEWQA